MLNAISLMLYIYMHTIYALTIGALALISNLESIAALGKVSKYGYKYNIKYKLSIKCEAIKIDKLIIYMTSTLIYCS